MVNIERLVVGIISGGPSLEAEVSRLSAKRITPPIEKHFQVVQLELDHTLPQQLNQQHVDVIFPVTHGPLGEDGSLQGLLDIMQIPYIGSGVLSSACAMDKVVTKRILQYANIPVAKDVVVNNTDSLDESVSHCISKLGNKLIVKPRNLGSGIGVHFTHSPQELSTTLAKELEYNESLLVEEYIFGKEITAGILDTGKPLQLPVIEITTPDGLWYDYVHRYTPGLSHHTIPANLSESLLKSIQDIALKAHLVLECRDLSRSDFIVSENGDIILTEVNNLPGMTPTSLFPDGARSAGIDFETLIKSLILHAYQRGKIKKSIKNTQTLPKLVT